jgi:hypothetical protein
MTTIPFYYVWTPKYKVLADILKQSLAHYSTIFEDKGVFMEQEMFDSKMYKAPGHYLNGCYIKLEKTYELLTTLPENSYFIFSDADMLLLPGKPLQELMNFYTKTNADIVFMRESFTSIISNIGFSLIKVCEANRKLFSEALEQGKLLPGSLDQSLINEALSRYNGFHCFFPPEFVITTCTAIESQTNYHKTHIVRKNCIIFQPLIDPSQSIDASINEKLLQYKYFGLDVRFT